MTTRASAQKAAATRRTQKHWRELWEKRQNESDADRYREALERLVEAMTDVRVGGNAARLHAVHEAWRAGRDLLDETGPA